MGDEPTDTYRPGNPITKQPSAAFSGEGMSLQGGSSASASAKPTDAAAMRAARLARFESAGGGGGRDPKAD